MSVGIFNTTNLTTDHASKSFGSMITRLAPNGSAQLFGLSSLLGTETAKQFEHGFFTKTMIFPSVQANGSATSSATTLTVDSTTNILPGMVLRVNEGSYENLLVISVVSATQITVSRGFGTVAAASISDNTVMYSIGTAFEESSVRPSALVINPVRVTNYTQIFRNTWAISDSIRATMMIAGDTNVAESRRDCALFHATDIEKALLFGQKTSGTRNGQPIHTMDGLINLVTTNAASNVTNAGGSTTLAQLEAALDPVFDQQTDPSTGNERVLFVGGTAKKVINGIGRISGDYNFKEGSTQFGLQFESFVMARGKFRMIEHPLLNSNTTWSKMAIAVDLATFRLAYLQNRKTQHKAFNSESNDGQAVDNGIDALGGTLTTEVTCVVKNPSANAVIYGLSTAA